MLKKRLAVYLLCLALCLSFILPSVATAEEAVTVDKNTLLSGLLDADISTIQEALTLGLITSKELTQYYLERIDTFNKPYNCFITMCDNALAVAEERDEQRSRGEAQGLLFGVPIVVKDNMDYEGFLTTNGYKKENSKIADNNADVVQAFIDAGAIILGKTNMSTGAQDAICSTSKAAGQTKNAYNSSLASGGSSGGSAVAASLNFAAAALGTDTNSSLRIPAALNGCVALRPTFGLLSNKGIKRLNSTRDTAGAITRTVYDQAIMLDVLTGGQFRYTENLNPDILQGLRIGILEELSYATKKESKRKEDNIDKEVSGTFAQAVSELESLGAEIIPVSIPKLFSLSNRTFNSGDASLKEALYDVFMETLTQNNVSVLIFPTYLSTPIRSGVDENGKKWDPYAQVNINNCRNLSSCAQLPEISIPIGTHSLGAGIGMEIAAPKNCEQLLLDIAYAYTKNYDHRTVPAGAPDTYAENNNGSLQEVIQDYLFRLEESQKETTIPEETTQKTVENLPENTPAKDNRLFIAALYAGIILVCAAVPIFIVLVRRKEKSKSTL